MKYDDFKIFKFSTISKRINRIRGGFPKIRNSIKVIQGYIIDFFEFIIKYILINFFLIEDYFFFLR